MIDAEYRFTLPVSAREAFDLLSDPAREPQWRSVCVEARLLDEAPAAGCRYEITFLMLDRRMTFTAEILAYEPGVRSDFTVLQGPFGYSGSYVYTENPDGGTEVHWIFRVDPGDYFGVMPHSLVSKLLIDQIKKDSDRLAERLRGTPAVGAPGSR